MFHSNSAGGKHAGKVICLKFKGKEVMGPFTSLPFLTVRHYLYLKHLRSVKLTPGKSPVKGKSSKGFICFVQTHSGDNLDNTLLTEL